MPSALDSAAVTAALRAAVGRRLGRVVVVERTGSTSADLVAQPALPDWSVVVADHQVAGRGRAGRSWTTSPREALTLSVLLRPQVPVDRFGWLPLLGGLAVVGALEAFGVGAVLKWPNDVLVATSGPDLPGWGRWRKVAGVLGEVAGTAVVVGIGVNVAQRTLPVPTATSLALVGAEVDRTQLLATLLGALAALDDRWRATAGDAEAAGLAAECAHACVTLGTDVRVLLPGGRELSGRATGLGADGALQVVDLSGQEHTVLAGDIEHLRR